MKRTTILFAWAALAMAGCSKDETPDGHTLPEGQYPLEIASVTMSVESSSEPWGADASQTRVAENADGTGSAFEDVDKIKVQIGEGNTGTYTYQEGGLTVAEGDKPAYWTSKDNAQSIRAWYTSSGSKTVELGSQTEGLAYVLTAQTTANFNSPVPLEFGHALAKVRVVLEGDKKDDVTDVRIKTATSCTLSADGTPTEGGQEDFIPMVKTAYNGVTYWEANVMPGHKITEFLINGTTEGTLVGGGITPQKATINTITINVSEAQIIGGGHQR